MEAPDKIYLYREKQKDYFDEDWHESSASDVENIAYIRKDLLIDWARRNQDRCFSVVEDDLWQELIDKINTL